MQINKSIEISLAGDILKNLYLIFTQTGTSASRFFKAFTRMPYNHASISFDKELNQMYSFGRRMLYFQFVAGFIQENPDTHVYKRFPQTTCRVVSLPVTDEQYELAMEVVLSFTQEAERYKYDILGVPARAVGLQWQRSDRYVCSEFVGLVLSRAGILPLTQQQCYFLKPSDLYNIPDCDVEYVGTLKEYNRGNFQTQRIPLFNS